MLTDRHGTAAPAEGVTASSWEDVLATATPWWPAGSTALVVVPHPDDEAVVFGGFIARAVRLGWHVHVLAVTDGSAAYPGAVGAEGLAVRRRREQDAAIGVLGLAPHHVTRLGLPDGAVADHEAALTGAISGRLHGVEVVVAPWAHDHHTDHEACGRATLGAVARTNAPVTTAYGLFWSLLRTPPPPGLELGAVDLSLSEVQQKLTAISRHESQVGGVADETPVLGRTEMAVARRRRECYVIGPR